MTHDGVSRTGGLRHRGEEKKIRRRSHRGEDERIASDQGEQPQNAYRDEAVDRNVQRMHETWLKVAQQPMQPQMIEQYDHMLKPVVLIAGDPLQG